MLCSLNPFQCTHTRAHHKHRRGQSKAKTTPLHGIRFSQNVFAYCFFLLLLLLSSGLFRDVCLVFHLDANAFSFHLRLGLAKIFSLRFAPIFSQSDKHNFRFTYTRPTDSLAPNFAIFPSCRHFKADCRILPASCTPLQLFFTLIVGFGGFNCRNSLRKHTVSRRSLLGRFFSTKKFSKMAEMN